MCRSTKSAAESAEKPSIIFIPHRLGNKLDSKPLHSAPILILDSNAVFDWLLFDDPRCSALGAAVTGESVRWIATKSMLAEADEVMDRGDLDRFAHRHETLRKARARWVHEVEEGPPPPKNVQLTCTDPDDQMFIDLAIAFAPSCLVTRDKALLALARAALAAGVVVCEPAQWQPKPLNA
jgi:predicted nucleic acid-binding protein